MSTRGARQTTRPCCSLRKGMIEVSTSLQSRLSQGIHEAVPLRPFLPWSPSGEPCDREIGVYSLDLCDGGSGFIFTSGVHIQTDQNNSRDHVIGGKLKGFLEGSDPLLIPSGFAASDTEMVVESGYEKD